MVLKFIKEKKRLLVFLFIALLVLTILIFLLLNRNDSVTEEADFFDGRSEVEVIRSALNNDTLLNMEESNRNGDYSYSIAVDNSTCVDMEQDETYICFAYKSKAFAAISNYNELESLANFVLGLDTTTEESGSKRVWEAILSAAEQNVDPATIPIQLDEDESS